MTGPSDGLRGAASNSRVNSFASAALDDEAETSPLPSCAMRDMSLVRGWGGAMAKLDKFIWLVVDLYPSEKCESHLGLLFPTEWKKNKCSEPPTSYEVVKIKCLKVIIL